MMLTFVYIIFVILSLVLGAFNVLREKETISIIGVVMVICYSFMPALNILSALFFIYALTRASMEEAGMCIYEALNTPAFKNKK